MAPHTGVHDQPKLDPMGYLEEKEEEKKGKWGRHREHIWEGLEGAVKGKYDPNQEYEIL